MGNGFVVAAVKAAEYQGESTDFFPLEHAEWTESNLIENKF